MVSTCSDGETALAELQGNPHAFDVALLDVEMPGLSGYEICTSLREQGSTLPVIVISGRTLAIDREWAYRAGANNYLTKPVNINELRAIMENLLAAPRGVEVRRFDASK